MLPVNFKPMLAINYDDVKVQPQVLWMSEKLDGVPLLPVFLGFRDERDI